MRIEIQNIEELNDSFTKKDPVEVVKWVLELAKKPIVTTNFRPYEAAILYLTTQIKNDIPVVWCDTGYNTPQTYRHAEKLISDLKLNVDLYVPKQTSAHRDIVMGIPMVDDPNHAKFTQQVKLEPFKRALENHQPDVWFTNLRKGQTAFRDNIGVLSFSAEGILKVSPFYHFSDEEMDKYLEKNKLPNETKYFDPTKAVDNRECGLHTTH